MKPKRFVVQAFVRRRPPLDEFIWRTVSSHDTRYEAEAEIPEENKDSFVIIDTYSQGNIGENIASLIRQQGETVAEFAKRARLNPHTLYEINGKYRTPRPSTLQKIAKALKVPIEALLVTGYDW